MVFHSSDLEWEAENVDKQRDIRINIIGYNLAE